LEPISGPPPIYHTAELSNHIPAPPVFKAEDLLEDDDESEEDELLLSLKLLELLELKLSLKLDDDELEELDEELLSLKLSLDELLDHSLLDEELEE
jgi:hypothetical protein